MSKEIGPQEMNTRPPQFEDCYDGGGEHIPKSMNPTIPWTELETEERQARQNCEINELRQEVCRLRRRLGTMGDQISQLQSHRHDHHTGAIMIGLEQYFADSWPVDMSRPSVDSKDCVPREQWLPGQ